MVEKSLVSRQEAKIRELETKLEYERTQIKRLEVRRGEREGEVARVEGKGRERGSKVVGQGGRESVVCVCERERKGLVCGR